MRYGFEIFASFCLLCMAALGVALLWAMPMAHAQVAQVCNADNSACPALGNDISNSLFKTDSISGTVMVTGTITTRPPAVPNSMVYKDAVGVIRTASSTYVSNSGTANESLITANINANVLNTNVLKLISPSSLPACNAGTNGSVYLSGAKVCVCDGTGYKNLLGGTSLITGLLTGTCP